MAYTHVQFIAYEVPTGVALPAGSCDPGDLEICKGVEGDAAYKQAMSSLSNDLRVRVARLLTIIDLTRSSKAARTEDTTLKIFMAPEFYLRPEEGQASRSYAASDMVAAQEVFRAVFSQSMLAGWVCVLGTLVWNMKGKVVASSAASEKAKKYVEKLQALANKDFVYNSAVVGVGGAGVWVYDKVHYADPADQVQKENWPLKEYCMNGPLQTIVEAGNVHCGLEVCRDHQMHLLNQGVKAMKASLGNQANAVKLDLQLLTACGMPIQKNSVVVGKDALVFRVDGAVEQSNELFGEFTHSEIQVVAKADARGATEMVNLETDGDRWKELNAPEHEVPLTGDLKLDVTGKKGTVKPRGISGLV